jgi:exodeoxyribonuclease III
MKIVSWNINSLRLRLNLLKELMEIANPDIICLQEIKVENALFPLDEVRALGFDFIEFDGEKSYNGVAIISKIPLKKINKIDVCGYGHKRHISAVIDTAIGEVELHNFYVPAGGDIADVALNEKFDHKLKFVDFMKDFFAPKKSEKTIILGDFNIAPLENDVWSHKQLLKVVSHTPIEVEKLNALLRNGHFIDTHRKFIDEKQKLYSWWSYRGTDPMKSNRGRRLDHIWATIALNEKIISVASFIDFRTKNQPSDHIPILTEFAF